MSRVLLDLNICAFCDKYIFKPLIIIITFVWLNACESRQNIDPPTANVIPKSDTLHGDIRIDNYYWLHNKTNPEVIEYLETENKYVDSMMKHTENLQHKLYNELVSRIKETDLSVPEKIDNYYYYTRTEEGKQYKIYYRKKTDIGAPEEIMIDENKLALSHEYYSVVASIISPNHQLLAFVVDTTGSRNYLVYFKNLNTGDILNDQLSNIHRIVWANDNKTLFYTTLDSTNDHRGEKLYRHLLGTDPKNDFLIYHEKDKSYYLQLNKSRSEKFIFLNADNYWTSNEVYYIDADNPKGNIRVIHPRQPQLGYSVYHHDDSFYIQISENAPNGKVMKVSIQNPVKKYWKEFIPQQEMTEIWWLLTFENHLVVYERRNGVQNIRIYNHTTGEFHDMEYPEKGHELKLLDNPEYNTNLLRISYSSFITPKTIIDYNMDTKKKDIKKQEEVLGDYNPSEYQSERIFAIASDCTKIPISIVSKKDIQKDGKNPLLLYGYGSDGIFRDPHFDSNLLTLLERGFIYAIAHVRGGGEMGQEWHKDGKLLMKKNTFTDFIACAEYLIDKKYTSSDKLIIKGASAGGLLMGVVVNMKPDLFKAVIADVPWVDIITFNLAPTYYHGEYGNPNDEEYYRYMRSYSPYDNVEAKNYPNMFITAGLNDLDNADAARWTAKLRSLKTDQNLLLLKTNMAAGHSGVSGRYDILKNIAFEYAFIFDLLGIKE
jgi:oligopeptidase B